ncbi:hypothetical protein L2E82_24188 [Cichorium intybus]|uniref:Uncharacterized protein n=1 Tax=Cichorium intybus TaxID=13427 RepID=A0ACB9E0W6_CICIN|nr:hypothetical protein L2E82_24188 [Cichorium intybus]
MHPFQKSGFVARISSRITTVIRDQPGSIPLRHSPPCTNMPMHDRRSFRKARTLNEGKNRIDKDPTAHIAFPNAQGKLSLVALLKRYARVEVAAQADIQPPVTNQTPLMHLYGRHPRRPSS